MGRPSKGLRARLNVRVPLSMYQQIADEARRRGLTINDWVEWALTSALRRSQRQGRDDNAA